jgi:hypothetical protein
MRDRLLVCGNPDDPSVALILARGTNEGAPCVVLSQRRFATSTFEFEIAHRRVIGTCVVDGHRSRVDEFGGVYLRLADDHRLPELVGEPAASPLRRRAEAWRSVVTQWADIAPAKVISRPSAIAAHCSRPLQSQIMLRHGFSVPETLVTTEPELALDFCERHSQVLWTSASGVKPPPRRVGAKDLTRLERIRWSPAQFQALVEGRHVRVHVIANEVFTTGVTRPGTDQLEHWPAPGTAPLYALKPSDDLAAQSITLAMELDLPFAAFDLRITPDNEVYCLEVHPNPDFSDCERQAGQPISAALVRYLSEVRVAI